MKPLDFFSTHPVFTREDFAGAITDRRTPSNRTVDSHLGRYLRTGRIGRVKRGVFFAAAPGEAAVQVQVAADYGDDWPSSQAAQAVPRGPGADRGPAPGRLAPPAALWGRQMRPP